MNKYRYIGLGLGSAVSILYLGIAGAALQLFRYATPLDLLIVICGPLSLIFATPLGWMHQEKVSAWWLLGGSAATTGAVLLTNASALLNASTVVPVLLELAVLALPMLVCGLLLRKSVAAGHSRPGARARAEETLCPFTYKGSFHEK